MNAISNWAGQVTTGHGAMVLVGTLLACLHGDMTWAAGSPLLAAGFIGVIWPENTGLAAQAGKIASDAQPLLTDIEPMVRRALVNFFTSRPPSAAPVAPPAPSSTAGCLSLRGALLVCAVTLLAACFFLPWPSLGGGAVAALLAPALLALSAPAWLAGDRRLNVGASGISRRHALGGLAGLLGLGALVEACTSSAPAATPAQIIADAAGAVATLQADLPLMKAADPNLMTSAKETEVLADLSAAQGLLTAVTPQVAAIQAATILQKVETLVNTSLDEVETVATAAAASPLAPYAPRILAVTVLVQGLEAWVNATLGTASAAASARAKAVAPIGLTPAKARQILGIGAVA